MAPPKAGFGKREDRPMPPWMRPEADTARQKPRRRWVMKRDRTPPRHEDPGPRRPGNAAPPPPRSPMIEPLIETAPDEFIHTPVHNRAAHASQDPIAAAAPTPTEQRTAPAALQSHAAAVRNVPAYEHPATAVASHPGSQHQAEPRYEADPEPEYDTQYEEAQYEPEYATEYEPEPQPEYELEYEPEPRRQQRHTHQPSARNRNSRETAVEDSATRWSRHGVPPPETTETSSIAPAEVPAEVAAAEWTGGGAPPEVVKPSRRIPAWLLAAVGGVAALGLFSFTGAGQGVGDSVNSAVVGITKMFEPAPLPACPTGQIRAPDKKCWPVRKKSGDTASTQPPMPTPPAEASPADGPPAAKSRPAQQRPQRQTDRAS